MYPILAHLVHKAGESVMQGCLVAESSQSFTMVNTKKVMAMGQSASAQEEEWKAVGNGGEGASIEEVKGSSFGKGRGKITVGFSNLK